MGDHVRAPSIPAGSVNITSSAGAVALSTFSQADQLWLARYCAYHSGDRDAAEDLAQETLVEAWRNQAALDVHAKLPRMAQNQATYGSWLVSRKVTRCTAD